MHEEIEKILAKYFTGEASPQDLDYLDTWLAESQEHEEYFEQMTFAFQQSGFSSDKVPNSQKGLKKFRKYIYKNKNRKLYISIAASIILLLGFGVWKVWNESEKNIQLVYDIPGYYILPEGTKLYLWENSAVTINKDYNITNREIILEGKASFDIQKGENELLVRTKYLTIEDIGTVFTVNTLDSAFVKVVVESGIVVLHPLMGIQKELVVQEDEIAIYTIETGIFNKFTLNAYKHPTSIVFQASKLSEVASKLSEVYRVDIVFDNVDLKDRKITVTFIQEDIKTIMDIISNTLGVKYSKEGNTYTISNH